MKKRRFKMPSSYAILFGIIVVVAILTWIVPGGSYVRDANDELIEFYDYDEGYIGYSIAVPASNDELDIYQAAVYDKDGELLGDVVDSNNEPVYYVSEGEGKDYLPYTKGETGEYVSLSGEAFILDENNSTTAFSNPEYVGDNKSTYLYYELGEDQVNQGFWQVVAAPIEGFYDAVDIALFVLVIGGFIEIVLATQALDAGISKLLHKYQGNEIKLIPILMILFGIGGTTFGMAEETIAFYPLLIPVMLAAGFDVTTAVMTILLGAGTGVFASTVNPFAIGAAVSSSGVEGVSVGTGIIGRFILLIIAEALAILFTLRYAKKIKKDKQKYSITADIDAEIESQIETVQEVKFVRKHAVILTLFVLSFAVMILGVIPWAAKFDIFIFENINNWIADHIPFIGFFNSSSDVYFSSDTSATALGDWYFGQMTVWFFVMAIVIGLINKMSSHEITNTFVDGSRALLGVALIIGMSRGIKVVMSAGGMDATLLYYGSAMLKKLGDVAYIIGTYIFFIPMSFLIPSTSGLAGAAMPIMGPLGEAVYGGIDGTIHTITSYSAASGVVNLITPTSGVVMGGLAIAKLPYERWVKHVFPFMLILSALTIIALVVFTVTGFSA